MYLSIQQRNSRLSTVPLDSRKDEKAKDDEIGPCKRFPRTKRLLSSRKYLSEIIRARHSEIFYFVNNELKKIGKDGMLPEGAVITGGGAKVRDMNELAKEVLRLFYDWN